MNSRNGDAYPVSMDHKVTSLEEQERLKGAGIEVHDGMTRLNGATFFSINFAKYSSGMAICRTLGDSFLKKGNTGVISEPFISECIKIESTDTFLIIASDGVSSISSCLLIPSCGIFCQARGQ
jgi:serine/threonine protein phosphatase PrpC